jgi:hypothetical protein
MRIAGDPMTSKEESYKETLIEHIFLKKSISGYREYPITTSARDTIIYENINGVIGLQMKTQE